MEYSLAKKKEWADTYDMDESQKYYVGPKEARQKAYYGFIYMKLTEDKSNL
jgi:hypothetical protein